MKIPLALSLALALLPGCQTNSRTAATGTPLQSVTLGPPSKAVTITDRQRGVFVPLAQNGTVTVSLQSNQLAGYGWKLARRLKPEVLKLETPPQPLPRIALPPDDIAVTAPGTQDLVFKAVGPGTARVHLIYTRLNQPLNQSADYIFTVNVE